MALNHFRAQHFGAKHFTVLGTLGSIIAAAVDWILWARKRHRR